MFQFVPTMFLQWWKPSSPRCCLKPKALVKTQAQFLAYNLHVSISTNHVSAMVEAK